MNFLKNTRFLLFAIIGLFGAVFFSRGAENQTENLTDKVRGLFGEPVSVGVASADIPRTSWDPSSCTGACNAAGDPGSDPANCSCVGDADSCADTCSDTCADGCDSCSDTCADSCASCDSCAGEF